MPIVPRPTTRGDGDAVQLWAFGGSRDLALGWRGQLSRPKAGQSREETTDAATAADRCAGCYRGAIDGAPSAALDAAVKACPDQSPFLRIETGMHTAPIRRIGVDAACHRAATASDDKTVRVWSLPDGRLERTIRLPIGTQNEGKVFAVALSPDGRRLAAGGWDASYAKLGFDSLSLVDLDSGSIRRVGTLPRTWPPKSLRLYLPTGFA